MPLPAVPEVPAAVDLVPVFELLPMAVLVDLSRSEFEVVSQHWLVAAAFGVAGACVLLDCAKVAVVPPAISAAAASKASLCLIVISSCGLPAFQLEPMRFLGERFHATRRIAVSAVCPRP